MKRYTVRLTQEVEADLLDLFEYIAQKDSVANAYRVLDELDALISSLDQHPERGHHPPELSEHGIKEFREVFFKPYRVIYQLVNNHVVVLGCFDGRRDMQLLLERRLLR
ncbi:MAG: type II toxin-antitoxin system RelE/ParE family toxin [Gammaproteobacteria bacterium]|nr:type II toxin-antitoxin system RelE/ParE family toxin [Gammaproteobacteria bacterium]